MVSKETLQQRIIDLEVHKQSVFAQYNQICGQQYEIKLQLDQWDKPAEELPKSPVKLEAVEATEQKVQG